MIEFLRDGYGMRITDGTGGEVHLSNAEMRELLNWLGKEQLHGGFGPGWWGWRTGLGESHKRKGDRE